MALAEKKVENKLLSKPEKERELLDCILDVLNVMSPETMAEQDSMLKLSEAYDDYTGEENEAS